MCVYECIVTEVNRNEMFDVGEHFRHFRTRVGDRLHTNLASDASRLNAIFHANIIVSRRFIRAKYVHTHTQNGTPRTRRLRSSLRARSVYLNVAR